MARYPYPTLEDYPMLKQSSPLEVWVHYYGLKHFSLYESGLDDLNVAYQVVLEACKGFNLVQLRSYKGIILHYRILRPFKHVTKVG